jgi:uncharacterized protein (UPF0332 family)
MATPEQYNNRIEAAIVDRRWVELLDGWLSYISLVHDDDLMPHIPSIDYPLIKETIDALNRQPANIISISAEIPGYRLHLFKEAFFLINKSIHVLSVAETNIEVGKVSWALSEGYHSAFFAVKAILALYGINFIDHAGKVAIVDVWRKKDIKKSQSKYLIKPAYEMLFVKSDLSRLGHNHVWAAFKRLLRVSKRDLWNEELFANLNKISVKNFSAQRDLLHYSRHSWIYDDLLENKVRQGFGTNMLLNDLNCEFDSDLQNDFSIVLAFNLIEMFIKLFNSIETHTKLLTKHKNIVEVVIKNRKTHPIYFASLM